MSQAERVKYLIDKLNTTQKEFAQSLGISAPRLNNYLTGKREFPLDVSILISQLTNCDLLWLITGNGDMYIDMRTRECVDSIEIPVYAEISAGSGIEAENIEPKQYVSVDKHYLEGHIAPYYAFEVKGTSMEPEMHTGDIVVVAGWDFEFDYNGKLCAFRTIDGLLVKRLFYEPVAKCLYLIPLNPTNPILKYDENSPNLTLIGMVVALVRKYK